MPHEDPPGTFARFPSLAHRRFADTRKFRSAERDEIRAFLARRGAGRMLQEATDVAVDANLHLLRTPAGFSLTA